MRIQRTSDVKESIGEKFIYYFFGGLVCFVLGTILMKYRGASGLGNLAGLVIVAGVGLVGYGIYVALQSRKVSSHFVDCPICTERNEIVQKPDNQDITCVACNHLIPIKDGVVLPVMRVNCGFCNSVNYYSEKSEVLICETCNHEIPIFQEDGKPTKQLPKGYAIVDDNALYELVLTDVGKGSEELVRTLQSMLALNRNQVKDLMEELPVTLLQGITKMKAEMLAAQLSNNGAKAEPKVLQQQ
jgi:uncharacterized protein YbaR (Trm112 family)